MAKVKALHVSVALTAALMALSACSGTSTTNQPTGQAIPSLVDAATPNAGSTTSNSAATSPGSANPSDSAAGNTSETPSTAEDSELERDRAIALAIRDKLEQAYNQLPTDVSLSTADYDRIFLPVWDSAERYGFSLTRKPVPYIDGFTLNATQATQPGHSLITELTSGLQSYCVASTDVLNPAILSETQWEEALELPREFLLLAGSCQPHIEWISSYIATMPPSAAPSATPAP